MASEKDTVYLSSEIERENFNKSVPSDNWKDAEKRWIWKTETEKKTTAFGEASSCSCENCERFAGKEDEREYFSKDYGRYKGVMVWMGISSVGMIHVERMEGKIDSETYAEMIPNRALSKIHQHDGTDFILQQDNASMHVLAATLEAFAEAEIEMLPHPALSPDLNPVENVWALLVRRIYAEGRGYESEGTLWTAIEEEAGKLTKEEIAPFIDSMPRRYLTVVEKRGSYIQ
jgi:transposase